MEAAVGAASSLLGKVFTKLSDDFVAAYVDSLELGHNSEQIKTKLKYVQGLLHLAEGRDVSNNRGLQSLLEDLGKKAGKAEDVLDELHYFKIQDDLDGTNDATTQEAAPDQALHGRHAFCHTVGNLLQCFSCWPTQDDDSAVASNPHYTTTQSDSGNDGSHVDKLPFDRVNMSQKIKSVIEDIHSLCGLVSDLLNKIPNNSTTATLTRPQIGSAVVQDKLYGRGVIFEKTVGHITSCGEILSVLPVVGPGGIGKTTFTQHLYNATRTQEHFSIRVWVCVSTDFDVLKLTKEIHDCILETEKERSNTSTNLSKLQETIGQKLKSKRFLIVLDDIWKCGSENEWKTLLAPFKKGEANGNMVLVTTRFPKLAEMMKTIDPIELRGLESNDFFTFFEACIFGDHNKPRHYEDDLTGIAREIANKLKGSPLAAKTVGRLLKKDFSQEHWNEVLQNREWRNQQHNDDILPSLKISYDYIPSYLKKCFSYCALFPEDHRLNSLEINRFWIAVGIIDSSHRGDNKYLEELVDNGFLIKGVDYKGQYYYVMHDLMHELSRSVSKQDCINISDLNFRADDIPKSVRHLSITIENRYDKKFVKKMGELKRRIDIGNLQTLMIFRKYKKTVAGILRDTFKDINGLLVLFITVESLDYLPPSFSKLIRLQYLKIGSSHNPKMTLPSTLSRFYHLKFLDLESWRGSSSLPKDISRLVNLRDFLAKKELHSNVPEVGKMKYIQELKEFHVKKERVGFELKQLGGLEKLGGKLTICNLENVATKEEASEAKLNSKENLKELTLVWDREHPIINADVLDGLQPIPNLRALGIINHGGTTGPSWLCLDIWVKSLETLRLEGISWGTLPPFGQLPHLKELILKRISGIHQFGPEYGGIAGKCCMHNLKKVVFDDLPELVKWVVEPNCHSFPKLENIECSGCPNLRVMPFSECSCANLCRLHIDGCPKLRLPLIPHTSTLTEFIVRNTGSGSLSYNGKELSTNGYDGALALHNLDKVEDMSIAVVSHISLSNLEKLKSLRKLRLEDCNNLTVDGFNPLITVNLKELEVYNHKGSGNPSVAADLLSEVARTKLMPAGSFQLERLKVDSISAVLVAPICKLLAATLHTLEFYFDLRAEGFTEEQETALQLLSSLQKLEFSRCPGLQSLPQGLHRLSSLKQLKFYSCGELRLLPKEGFPASLQILTISRCGDGLTEQVQKLKERYPDLDVDCRSS